MSYVSPFVKALNILSCHQSLIFILSYSLCHSCNNYYVLAGYSIFVVIGELPVCEADYLLKLQPAVQLVKPSLLAEFAGGSTEQSGVRNEENWDESEDDIHLRQALEESRRLHDDDDVSLNQALQLSMSGLCTKLHAPFLRTQSSF